MYVRGWGMYMGVGHVPGQTMTPSVGLQNKLWEVTVWR